MAFNTPIHTNAQSIDRVLKAGLPVLLVFWRKDCAPCQQLDPALMRLAKTYSDKVLIAKVDVHDNPALVRRYNVTQLPGLVFVKDGQPVGQSSGAAPEAALGSWLDYLVQGGPRPAMPSGPSIALDDTSQGQAQSNGSHHKSTATQGATGDQRASTTSQGVVVLSDATFDQLVAGSDQPVLVDFWAPWCGPCRAVAPAVERLAQEFAGRAVVAKLNVDDNPRTAQRFGISSIPALYIFKRGQVVERLLGAQPAPLLRQALAKHAGR